MMAYLAFSIRRTVRLLAQLRARGCVHFRWLVWELDVLTGYHVRPLCALADWLLSCG